MERDILQYRRQHESESHLNDNRNDSIKDVVFQGDQNDLIGKQMPVVIEPHPLLRCGRQGKGLKTIYEIFNQRKIYEYSQNQNSWYGKCQCL